MAAVTVAVRGPWSSRASSPTQSPGPSWAMVCAAAGHVRVAVDDDEGLAAHVPLGDELLALVQRELDGRLGDVAQLLRRATREERDRGEMVEVVLACHGGAA